MSEAKAELKERLDRTFGSKGIFGSRGGCGSDYVMARNMGAAKGLYGNSDGEAWYGGYEGDGRR